MGRGYRDTHRVIETFLSFDLEQTFSSAFILTLMEAIPGLSVHDGSYLNTALSILSTIIAHGNMVAQYRKEELEKLQEILHLVEIIHNEDTAGPKTNHKLSSNNSRDLSHPAEHAERIAEIGSAANGLASSEEMLSIAGLLDWEPEISTFHNDQLAGSWLWVDAIAEDLGLDGGLL